MNDEQFVMKAHPCIAVLIPALNEERSIGAVVEAFRQARSPAIHQIIVADNGSSDATAERARAAGAQVVFEPHRGYGAACLAAIAAMADDVDVVVFADADGADDPNELGALVAPVVEEALAEPVAADAPLDADAPAVVAFELLTAPRGAPDDLMKLSGMGPELVQKLNDGGLFHFGQVAAMTPADISKVDHDLKLAGRIERDGWVAQARALADA